MTLTLTVIFLIAVIIAVIYVFLMMPRITDRADMDLLSTDYAHRGLHSAQYPESSLPAFALAAEQGFGIELDVRMSRDGVIVVFHDECARRLCGVDARISDMTLSEIRSLRLSGTPYGIPTLGEVLELVDGRVPLLIEIKGETKEQKLCAKLATTLDTYYGAFAVQSFNPLILAYFKRYRPRFARGQLTDKIKKVNTGKWAFVKGFLLTHLLLNVLSRPDFISISGKRRGILGFRLCTTLFKCKGFVWTVRTKEQYKLVRAKGYFAIFEKFKPQ